MKNLLAELTLFSIEKVRALHLTSFLVLLLLWTMVMSQAAQVNFDTYCKN